MFRNAIASGLLTTGLLLVGADEVGAQLEFGTPEKMGPNINDERYYEVSPSLSPDGLELFFCAGPGRGLYSAVRESTDSDFGLRARIGGGGSGGHPSISADRLSLYFHDRFDPDNLWVMTRDAPDADWGHAAELGPTVNSQYDDQAPSISADGLELYFGSDRPGESSGTSIWVTKRETVESSWEEPVELGPHINATSNDAGPEISADGLSLLFSSPGYRGGFGGADLWMATRETTRSDWEEPVNLGPEVNTSQSEISPHLSADGSEFYFSRGLGNVDRFDLWRVQVVSPPPEDALRAGDADQNHSFDQLDLVRVLQADKYLTGEMATWGEGDWNGAPGGSVGNPPAGDGVFNQLDVMKALASGLYMTGPHATVRALVDAREAHPSVGNAPMIGEIWGDAGDAAKLNPVSADLAAEVSTLAPAENLGGSSDSDTSVVRCTLGSSVGLLSSGYVDQPGVEEKPLLGDMPVLGLLTGDAYLGDVDLSYVPVPEPASILLFSLSVLALTCRRHRVSGRRPF